MRLQTVISILLALVVVVAVAFFTQQNIDLLQESFRLSESRSVPLYAALLAVFLLGFLPVVTILLVKTLQQDLAQRRQRRFDREARSVRGSYRRAVDLQEDSQWARAASEFEAVVADQPEEFSTLLRYGEVLRRQGRTEEALDVHRRASVLYPHSVAVLYQLAEDYRAQGSLDVAIQIEDRILRDFPGVGIRVLRQRRRSALRRQNWDEANRSQEKIEALEQEAGHESANEEEQEIRRGLAYEKGVELLASEQLAPAQRVFEEILSTDPGYVPARIMLGEVWSLAADPSAAVAEWRAGWEATGNHTFLQRIEDYFIEREEPLEAIETLRKVIAEAESDLVPRFFLAQLYARLEMADEALKVVASIRDRLHDSSSLLYLLGRLQERCGEQAKAREAFRTSLEMANRITHGYTCRTCGARYETWMARCGQCGNWNCVELHLDLEPVGGDEATLRERPVWPVYDKDE